MSDDAVIEIEDLSKAYRIGERERAETFIGALGNVLKSPIVNLRKLRQLNTFAADPDEDVDGILWALRHVSFSVRRGEVLGIIGRNGAGKSTLLKVLSRIALPTRGRVRLAGRVSALLEVGTGFHPELTGRENVYLNATILGMTKSEVDTKFDEIVEFAGISRFLDTPVKRYSSGMKVRLAFSVAAHLEPEILIVDEVLAVGDVEFQNKCLGKMQSVAEGEMRTVLFVSHNLEAVRRLCTRAVLLDAGEVVFGGSADETTETYLRTNLKSIGSGLRELARPHPRMVPVIDAVSVTSASGDPLIRTGDEVLIELEYVSDDAIPDAGVGLFVTAPGVDRLMTFHTGWTRGSVELPAGRHRVVCSVPDFPLVGGNYGVDIGINSRGRQVDWVRDACRFQVGFVDYFGTGAVISSTLVVRPHGWELP